MEQQRRCGGRRLPSRSLGAAPFVSPRRVSVCGCLCNCMPTCLSHLVVPIEAVGSDVAATATSTSVLIKSILHSSKNSLAAHCTKMKCGRRTEEAAVQSVIRRSAAASPLLLPAPALVPPSLPACVRSSSSVAASDLWCRLKYQTSCS